MTFIVLYSIILALKGFAKADKHSKGECGLKTFRREPRIFSMERNPRIIDGSLTFDGEFPWQVSLEVLHPTYGFLGHWCGGVLVDEFWILSAAHCIHNDIFNLPLPPLWTAVLGEHNRDIETGYERRVPIDKIITHSGYLNFQHDIVLLKLSQPIYMDKKIRKICLPLMRYQFPQSLDEGHDDLLTNFISLRKLDRTPSRRSGRGRRSGRQRKNDRFLRFKDDERTIGYDDNGITKSKSNLVHSTDLPYFDCIATGWGKSTSNENLTDTLFKTRVLIVDNQRCQDIYGSHVKIHNGHLCAGNVSGKGGTCIGDSGGPLQCRLFKNGPWILAGITSFGSGCADRAYYPDVYIRTSYYIKWIMQTMAQN